ALLVYGTGGLAYGGVNSSVSSVEAVLGPGVGAAVNSPAFAGGSYSNTRVGWTAGAGLEWMFWPNWSAKFEYLYYDLGSAHYLAGGAAMNAGPVGGSYGFGVASILTTASTQFSGHIFRAGLNYHFNWAAPAPVLA